MHNRASKLLILNCAASLFLLGGLSPAQAKIDKNTNPKTSAQLDQKLDAIVRDVVDQNLVVGLVLLVKHDGKLLYKRAAGFLDKEKGLAMPENAIFRYSSMSKAITTATALALQKDGILKMTDSVSKYLPYFTPKTKDGQTPEITLEEMASHTSGLDYPFIEYPDGPYHQANICDGLTDDGISSDQNLRKLATMPLLFTPGKGFRYSLGLDVLAEVIEKTTGAPLEKSVYAKIGKPLKMKSLTFTVKENQISRLTLPYCNTTCGAKLMGKNQFVAYGNSGFVFNPARATNKNAFQSGGSGLCGTAEDYMRFIESMQKDPEMCKVRSKGYPISFEKGWSFGYCGAILTDCILAKTPQNPGTMSWGGAYGHTWFSDPRAKISVVCMTNTTPYSLQGAFPDAVRDVVYNYLIEKKTKKEVHK